MHIDWWTLALQTINVVVLVWLLARYLFRPIAAIIAARQAEAAKILDEAARIRAEAATAQAAAEKTASEAVAARATALESATHEAAAAKENLLAQARVEVLALRQAGETDLVHARTALAREADARATALAIDIARRLFARLPDEARVLGFVPGLAEALSRLPPAAREDLSRGDDPVPLLAPRVLTEHEHEAVAGALAQVCGRPRVIAVTVDPGVIAGLEIDLPHVLVRNSFRADLERLSRELASADHDAS